MAVSYSLNRLSIFRHFTTICIDYYLLVSEQADYPNKTTDCNVYWILLPFLFLKSKTVSCTKLMGFALIGIFE